MKQIKTEDLISNLKNNIRIFLFRQTNPKYLAIFRIALCLITLFVFFYENSSRSIIYTSLYELYTFYDHYIISTPYLITCAITVLLFGVGYKSRLFGFISVILLFPLIFQQGSHVSRQLLLFTLFPFSFTRSDQLYSLNYLLNKNINYKCDPIWPIRLIQIQLSVLYLVNAIAKSKPQFINGEILTGMSMMMPNFKMDLSNGYLDLGFISIPVFILAISIIVSVYFIAIGLWIKKLRIFTAIFGISFHIFATFLVEIGFLDYVSVFLYLSFLLPWEKLDQDKIKIAT